MVKNNRSRGHPLNFVTLFPISNACHVFSLRPLKPRSRMNGTIPALQTRVKGVDQW